MQTAKIGYVIVSLLLCVLGVVMIVVPDFSASLIGTLCGIVLIVFGAFKLVGYFSKDLYRLAFQYDLAFGILTLALGIIILLNPDNIMNFICVVLGVAVLADGLLKIQIALDSKRFGIRKWWLILAVAFIACVCGILLLLRPSESIRVIIVLMGISLLAEGILNLSTVITAVKIVRNQQPDYIEIHEYTEKED